VNIATNGNNKILYKAIIPITIRLSMKNLLFMIRYSTIKNTILSGCEENGNPSYEKGDTKKYILLLKF